MTGKPDNDDPVQERIMRLKRISDTASMRAGLYCDVAKVGSGAATDGSLSCLRRAPAPGKKIQKIGFIMCWIPEPTFASCALGAPMILAGRYIEKKYNSSTLDDIGSVTKKTLSELHRGSCSV